METNNDIWSTDARRALGAVLSMMLFVGMLIASAFMPVSVLPPIARNLGITVGQTGKADSISGALAFCAALLCGSSLFGFAGWLTTLKVGTKGEVTIAD